MTGRNQRLGARGEQLAAALYHGDGFVTVDQNWRCRAGELDLVMAKRDLLVFVEVKTRSSDRFGTGLEAVDRRKLARLRRLAAQWLAEHDLRPRQIRIDVASVGPSGVEVVAGVG